jgi:hypothetical protein
MIKFALTIISAALLSGMCQVQNTPTLRRDGPANPQLHGNLAGFSVARRVWPTVKTNLPNGRKVTLTALVTHGRAVQVSIEKGEARTEDIGALEAALKKWRFVMPSDGTSPVSFSVTWEARDGKFVAGDVAVSVADTR